MDREQREVARQLITGVRRNAKDVEPRPLVLEQGELDWVFGYIDALEASEAYLERLEKQNARLQVQLETANRALEKAVRGD